MVNPMAQVYTKHRFPKKDWHSDDFRLRSTVVPKTFLRKCATSIVDHVCEVCDASSEIQMNTCCDMYVI